MSQASRPVVYCPKGGIHSDEEIQLVCLDPVCRSDNLCCIICKKERHASCKTVLLKQFYEDIQYKTATVDKNQSISFQQSLEDVQSQVEQSFLSFQKYVIIKLQKYEDKMREFFKQVSCENNKFQSFDVQHLKNESDPYLLQKSINSILDKITVSQKGQKIDQIDESFFIAERQKRQYQQFSQHFIQSLKKIHHDFSEEYKKLIVFQNNGYQKLENLNRSSLNNSMNNTSFQKMTAFSQTVESQMFNPSQVQQNQYQRQSSQQNFYNNNNQNSSFSQNNYLQNSQITQSQQPQQKQNIADISLMNLSELSQKMSVVVENNGVIKQGRDYRQQNQNQNYSRSLTPNESVISANQFQRQQSKTRQDRSSSPLQIQNIYQDKREERLYQAESKNSSLGRILEFKFSTIMKHINIDVVQHRSVARVTGDNHDSRMILLEPSIEARPLREVTIDFTIKNCKNISFSAPLAIGLCHQKFIETSGYQFIGDDLQTQFTKQPASKFQHSKTLSSYTSGTLKNTSNYREPSNHGCYLVSANGILRNNQDPSQDMRKSKIRFIKGDVIRMHWNPFKQTLAFTRLNSNETEVLRNVGITGDKLHPCVRLSYSTDSVQVN